jgi:hypothetical protein
MCEIKGCQGKARARGLCAKHYMRLLRQGDPEKLGRPGRPPKHDPYTELANLVGAGEWSRRTMATPRRRGFSATAPPPRERRCCFWTAPPCCGSPSTRTTNDAEPVGRPDSGPSRACALPCPLA